MIPAFTAANLYAWSIQVAVLVLVGGGAVYLARLRSPRVRLACFRALLVACLALPFVQPVVSPVLATPGSRPRAHAIDGGAPRQQGGPPGPRGLFVDVTPESSGVAGDNRPPVAWLPSWVGPVLLAVLGLGVAARLVWLAVGLLALRRLRRDADGDVAGAAPAAIARAIDLVGARAGVLVSQAVKHPVTFGLRRPVVLLPDSCTALGESEQVAVLCHELLHVRRRDWLHTVLEEIVRAVLWFHPAIWWLLARIDLSREQLVDQEVVALTDRRQPYLNALVALALTPAGPILRPASLFLRRAHLVQRVALLSREVRMSRPRLIASLAVVTAVLIVGGQFVVRAFPLTAAEPAATPAIAAAQPSLPDIVLRRETPPGAGANVPAAQARSYPEVLQRVEPTVIAQPPVPGADTIVAMQVTIEPTGQLLTNGPVEMFVGKPGSRIFEAKASGAEAFQRMLDRSAARLTSGETYAPDQARPALDAVRAWQFVPAQTPFTTVIGFNFARGDLSGGETQPVRIGGNLPPPTRIRNVAPVYPLDAQDKRIQGVVILELVIDGAGIPISAYALRPVEGLTMAAVQAALQWRYNPDANYSRRLMTVTVNFHLDGVTPPPPPTPPDVAGGVEGGMRGGVAGGVRGGMVGGVVGALPSSFGPPRSEWPNPIRVGGNIQAPTRIRDVAAVYPLEAVDAKVQGVVIVEILIGTDGTVQAGQILRSIPMLDQAALDAVKQWQYTPTLLNGNPVPVIMTTTVNFTLR